MELNLLIALVGILGSGISAYVGVRVAMTELQGNVKTLFKQDEALDRRVVRLEEPYFDRRAPQP